MEKIAIKPQYPAICNAQDDDADDDGRSSGAATASDISLCDGRPSAGSDCEYLEAMICRRDISV